MKKKVLFLLPHCGIGGTMTSLMNLVPKLDKNLFEIDIMFIMRDGILLERMEQAGNVLPENPILEAAFHTSGQLISKRRFGLLIRKILFYIKSRLNGRTARKQAFIDGARAYDNKYDCVVSYQEGWTQYLAENIIAPRHIAWVHCAYEGVVRGSSYEQLKTSFAKFDKVVFAADAIMHEFTDIDCAPAERSLRIYNTFNIDDILTKSREFTLEIPKGKTVIVSASRFAPVKRHDRALYIAQKLKADGVPFVWYMLGTGPIFDKVKADVEARGLTDCVMLTGQTANPYPYLLAADFEVICSDYEAHPMIAMEALILGKPVILCNYPSAAEAIDSGVNGIICDADEDSAYAAVRSVIDDPNLLAQLTAGAEKYCYNNDEIVEQVHALLNGEI